MHDVMDPTLAELGAQIFGEVQALHRLETAIQTASSDDEAMPPAFIVDYCSAASGAPFMPDAYGLDELESNGGRWRKNKKRKTPKNEQVVQFSLRDVDGRIRDFVQHKRKRLELPPFGRHERKQVLFAYG